MAQINADIKDNQEVLQKRKKVSKAAETWVRFRKSKSAMIGMVVFSLLIMTALFAGILVDYEEDVVMVNLPERLKAPSAEYPFGTDGLGRDILARMIYGTRISLSVAFTSVIYQVNIGTILGAIAGFYGGKVDNVLMRINDVFAAIPNLLLAITIATALGHSITNMIIAIGVSGTPALVRIVRATVMTVKNQEYVEAGRALGGNDRQIIIFHLIPYCIAPIIVQGTLRIAAAILATSSLSFLGIGIKPPTPEWGNMLSAGREF